MKDTYSFDRDVEGLKVLYQKTYDACIRISQHFGPEFYAVMADNGTIDGSGSHELHVIADMGEGAIIYCLGSDYAANIKAAGAAVPTASCTTAIEVLIKTHTPSHVRCEVVAEQLGIPL